MNSAEDLIRENTSLRSRLSKLSEASLRINESLDFDTVLQGVLDSARSLTGALHGVMVFFSDSLQVQDFLTSGLTQEQAAQLWNMADGNRFFERIGGFAKPVRLGDFQGYVRELGLPEFAPPLKVSSPMPFLCSPITHNGVPTGIVYLADKEAGREFTSEDEEILVTFAAQAAMVIANAQYHREEQRARADLEALVNTAPVGVVVFDARTGVPAYVNREMMRIGSELTSSDHSAEEMIEAITVRRADGTEISMQELPVSTALSSAETVRAEEIVFRSPDGRSVSVILNATPIRSREGETVSVVVTVQDMSPLEDIERLRAEFLAMVSHELRTPLTSIKGSAATLIGSGASLDPSESNLIFRIIEQQADHMSGLITDLLDLARIKAGALSISPEPVEAAILVDQARSAFLSSGGRNNLRMDLPPELPRVTADRRRIVQVLVNLLSNADRNSPQLSAIRVAAERKDVHVEFSVADDGVGISKDGLTQLFRKFSRQSDEAGERKTEDSGLGLAIAKGIVEAHGGRIWAESDGPGQGARLAFTLPVVLEAGLTPNVESDQPPRRSGRTDGRRIRVLTVDDDPQTLRYVRDALSHAGYAPFTTGDPEAVGRLIAEERPHLVLLDLVLPGIDGVELMERVPEFSDVPVIFLSAYGQDQTIARALEAGADDYIVKPFSPTELVARIQTVLRRRSNDQTGEPPEPYVVGDLTVNYPERRAYLEGQPVQLTDIEYRMLSELSANAGRVMTHAELLRRVWGPAHSGRTGAVRSVIKNLRHKLGDAAANPAYIVNEPRVGYLMPKGNPQVLVEP